MPQGIFDECAPVVRDFLFYMETIKGRSPRTVQAYATDLRTFFRFMKMHRKVVPRNAVFEEIAVADIDIDFIKTITLSDVYEYMHFIASERENNPKTRARKVSCLKTFFGYLVSKVGLLEVNPVKELEVPSSKKSLPKYLTLEECYELLRVAENNFSSRDYCIITLFLNCGMRLSELCGLNLGDIRDNTLRLTGKGNKERIVYLNEACTHAIESYLPQRAEIAVAGEKALFLSHQRRRITPRRVEQIVADALKLCGLGGLGYSVHKLRHTAATLMYQHGGVDIRVLKEILGHENLGTTEIYTHVSSAQIESAADKNPLAGVKAKKRPVTPKMNTEAEK